MTEHTHTHTHTHTKKNSTFQIQEIQQQNNTQVKMASS